MIAKIVVDAKTSFVDKIFSYSVPEEFENEIQTGQRVEVPFGNGDKRRVGYVAAISAESDDSLKQIISIIDQQPLLDRQSMVEAYWIKNRYFCTFASALKLFLPCGAATEVKETVVFCPDAKDGKLTKLQRDILEFVKEKGSVSYDRIKDRFGKSVRSEIKTLAAKKMVYVSYSSEDNAKTKFLTVLSLADKNADYENILRKNASSQRRIINILKQCEFLSIPDLCMFAGCTPGAIKSLEEKNIIVRHQTEVTRQPYKSQQISENDAFSLTNEQKSVLNVIESAAEKPFKPILLRGVTGSGKTEVYIRAIEKTLENGKSAIVLVPEISLTHQMVSRFLARFGNRVALLHSKLSYGERFDEWSRIKKGDAKVVIGARSAVFAPCQDLGIIVVDEEHEEHYKSESGVRYDACEVAMYRAKNADAMLLLSSATPSVESYFRAKNGDYTLCEMNKRYNGVDMPQTEIVDMRAELKSGNKSPFSEALKREIRDNLERGEQTILFLNRRGYSTFVSCRSCGYVEMCENCNISMTYHRFDNSLLCHYCGKKKKMMTVCPQCGSEAIRGFGTGTQKIEEKLKEEFPEAGVIRMDVDTTSGKNSHQQVLDKFENEKIDILLGTQMVSKGLDFKNVTLVGVLAADQILNMGDYKAAERTFNMITQVCGRSGRGDKRGRAVIQTYMPDNLTLKLSSKHDYTGFYDEEIKLRRALSYPPYCDIINVTLSGQDEKEVKTAALQMYSDISEALAGEKPLSIYKATPCHIDKIKNKYRWHFWLKCVYNKEIHDIISEIAEKEKNITVTVDLNPVSV
ncbi:MAG: primosomal protein N' [Clostridia bacterium]|nr:primosomal protein N' [Clostridia bacterium]